MGVCFSTYIEKEFSDSAPPPPPRVPNMKVSDSTPPFPSKKERREAKYKRRKLKLTYKNANSVTGAMSLSVMEDSFPISPPGFSPSLWHCYPSSWIHVELYHIEYHVECCLESHLELQLGINLCVILHKIYVMLYVIFYVNSMWILELEYFGRNIIFLHGEVGVQPLKQTTYKQDKPYLFFFIVTFAFILV